MLNEHSLISKTLGNHLHPDWVVHGIQPTMGDSQEFC